jgi:hypothetical protein
MTKRELIEEILEEADMPGGFHEKDCPDECACQDCQLKKEISFLKQTYSHKNDDCNDVPF